MQIRTLALPVCNLPIDKQTTRRRRQEDNSAVATNLPHAPHDAELLRVDEALQHDPDGHVDVVLQHVVPQVHLGVGLGHADHGLDVTNRDGDAACCLMTTPNQQLTI